MIRGREITVICPHCHRHLKLNNPSSIEGNIIHCKGCGREFDFRKNTAVRTEDNFHLNAMLRSSIALFVLTIIPLSIHGVLEPLNTLSNIVPYIGHIFLIVILCNICYSFIPDSVILKYELTQNPFYAFFLSLIPLMLSLVICLILVLLGMIFIPIIKKIISVFGIIAAAIFAILILILTGLI